MTPSASASSRPANQSVTILAQSMLTSTAPAPLASRPPAASGANLVISLASLLSIVAVPLGGALLDRARHRDAVVAAGLAGAGPGARRWRSAARRCSGASWSAF
jgi:hypothetical protein